MKHQKTFTRYSLLFSTLILMCLIGTPAFAEESIFKNYTTDSELFGAANIQPGESIQNTITPDNSTRFEIYKNDRNGVTFEAQVDQANQGWVVALGAPNDALLRVGNYELVRSGWQAPGFDNSKHPAIETTYNNYGCHEVKGDFEVFELEYAGDEILKFAADFIMYCDSEHEKPVFGSIRFQSDVPVTTIDVSIDNDGDRIPDQVDADDDNDGEHDIYDAFPLDKTETADADGDGIGNNADSLPADELCPNSTFANGKMWSGDIQLVDNSCSKTGQICENTYFMNSSRAGKSICTAGQWREYTPTHQAILPPVAVLDLRNDQGRAPFAIRPVGLGSFSDDTRTYAWNFGDGSPISYEIIPIHLYGKPGTYTLTLTVTDNLGQSDSASRKITVTEGFKTVSCPNTIFADGKMWSGELQYVDNSCSNEYAWCPGTYFSDLGGRFDAECRDGKWQQHLSDLGQ